LKINLIIFTHIDAKEVENLPAVLIGQNLLYNGSAEIEEGFGSLVQGAVSKTVEGQARFRISNERAFGALLGIRSQTQRS